MAKLQLVCRGFELGHYDIPAFDLRTGEVVTIQLPAHFDATSQLVKSLTGAFPRPEIEIHGRCVAAERAEPPVNWRRWLSDPRPTEWLTRRGFSAEESAAVLTRHGIDGRFRLSRFAATPRTLLGLELAYHSGAEVVLFSTLGLDPLGERAVQELVVSNLHRTAALYFAFPYMSQGVLHQRAMSGSTVVEVTQRTAVSV